MGLRLVPRCLLSVLVGHVLGNGLAVHALAEDGEEQGGEDYHSPVEPSNVADQRHECVNLALVAPLQV